MLGSWLAGDDSVRSSGRMFFVRGEICNAGIAFPIIHIVLLSLSKGRHGFSYDGSR
jgi:hypothetical protein